jgi:hypothetical protein
VGRKTARSVTPKKRRLSKTLPAEERCVSAYIFLSYLRENSSTVDRLKRHIEAAGITAWLDRERLDPGVRWEAAIRTAIREGSFFLACFSNDYASRERAYMNKELRIAIDELQARPVDRAWFIPIKLSSCEIPEFDLGAGETLRSLQYVDLTSNWDDGLRKLIGAINGGPNPRDATPVLEHSSVDHEWNGEDVAASRATFVGKQGNDLGSVHTRQSVKGLTVAGELYVAGSMTEK